MRFLAIINALLFLTNFVFAAVNLAAGNYWIAALNFGVAALCFSAYVMEREAIR